MKNNLIIQNLGVVVHHIGPTFTNAYFVNLFQTWLIEAKDNMGLIDLPLPRMSALS